MSVYTKHYRASREQLQGMQGKRSAVRNEGQQGVSLQPLHFKNKIKKSLTGSLGQQLPPFHICQTGVQVTATQREARTRKETARAGGMPASGLFALFSYLLYLYLVCLCWHEVIGSDRAEA